MHNVDTTTRGFLAQTPNPLRYVQHCGIDPYESLAMLADLVPHGSRVLDVGCGMGDLCAHLRDQRGAEAVGIEPHQERATVARSHGLNVECGVLDRSVADRLGKFDVVIFADVLEHLVDPVSVLEVAHRVLRPRGRVLASIPNIAHWTARLNLLLGRFDYEETGLTDATHLRWFTRKTVFQVFATAGFRIEIIQMTEGARIPVYTRHRPWCWLTSANRRHLIRATMRIAPNLIGVQFIVEAVPAYQPPCVKI